MNREGKAGPGKERWPSRSVSKDDELLRELANALTALGNYLTAADRAFRSGTGSELECLGQLLGKAIPQHERAVHAVRDIAKLREHRGSDNDWPDFR